ncbi:hypothetical protein BGX26_000197 [Mortierella sp. AD094]|nr:hypothetical protein BGX26_000197 [Mortierella sp. AD094]
MGDQEVSLFHIYGYIKSINRSGSHKADHAIQTIWESTGCSSSDSSGAAKKRGEKDRQCRIYIMDYASFWKGTLTRQDWEAQRHSRCEDMVNKDLYESLTRGAFKGAHKDESDKWGLALSVRSSTVTLGDLELTWAGSVTNTIGGRSLQQKTILGTMNLEKVNPEESKSILKQWIKTTIEERQKFEHLSSSLKAHVVGLDRQYKECKDLLVDFKLDKRRSQNDLLEKFRALINTKKEKIVKLVNSNSSLQERMELLENALKEERRKVALLEGKKVEDTDIDLNDIKKQEDGESGGSQPTSSTRGGRGRGRGAGRGRGRGKAVKVEQDSEVESSGPGPRSRKKAIKAEKKTAVGTDRFEDADGEENELPQPLPHPQDGYGWDEDVDGALHTKNEEDEEEEEPLVRKSTRNNKKELSSTIKPASDAISESVKHHLDDLSAGAQDLINRVSRVASIGKAILNFIELYARVKGFSKEEKSRIKESLSLTSTSVNLSPTKRAVKREESDQSDLLLGRRLVQDTDTKTDSEQNPDNHQPKRLKTNKRNNSKDADVGTKKTSTTSPPNVANASSRSRRKVGIAKVVVDRNSLDVTPQSPLLRSFPSTESSVPEGVKRTRSSVLLETSRRSDLSNSRRGKDNAAVASASIISEEDLYKELE